MVAKRVLLCRACSAACAWTRTSLFSFLLHASAGPCTALLAAAGTHIAGISPQDLLPASALPMWLAPGPHQQLLSRVAAGSQSAGGRACAWQPQHGAARRSTGEACAILRRLPWCAPRWSWHHTATPAPPRRPLPALRHRAAECWPWRCPWVDPPYHGLATATLHTLPDCPASGRARVPHNRGIRPLTCRAGPSRTSADPHRR